eukprot:101502_1
MMTLRLLVAITQILSIWSKSYVDWHNDARRSVNPSASNMKTMKVSYPLYKSAKVAAQKMCSTGRLVHSGARGVGENAGGGNMEYTMKGFIAEKRKWSYKKIGSDWAKSGHYTQMIWANTNQVGCYTATGCKTYAMTVCHYKPGGNYKNQYPYQKKSGRFEIEAEPEPLHGLD